MDLGIPGYAEEEFVGSGGFATVYKARQMSVGSIVAIKLIHAGDLADAALDRFNKESQAMGVLRWHPNIVTIYEAGVTEDHRPYLVMEYLPDGSLGDLIAKGPLDWREVTSIGVKLAGALASAHDEGLLHRDVKPDNVLRTRYGEPMLADFGIVRIEGGTRTQTGTLVASIAYTAPEVLQGQPATVLSDVYALGATLYALLGGAPPFYDDTDETFWPLINRITSDPLPDLRPAGVPEELFEVIEASLAKDPADRPRSAADLGRRLQRVEQHLGLVPSELRLPEGSVSVESGQATRIVGEEPVSPVTEQPVTPVTEPTVPPLTEQPVTPVTEEPAPADATIPAPVPPVAPAQPPPGPPETRGKRRWGLITAVVVLILAVGGSAAAVIIALRDDASGPTVTSAADVTQPLAADTTAGTVPQTTAPATTVTETTAGPTTTQGPTTTTPPPTVLQVVEIPAPFGPPFRSWAVIVDSFADCAAAGIVFSGDYPSLTPDLCVELGGTTATEVGAEALADPCTNEGCYVRYLGTGPPSGRWIVVLELLDTFGFTYGEALDIADEWDSALVLPFNGLSRVLLGDDYFTFADGLWVVFTRDFETANQAFDYCDEIGLVVCDVQQIFRVDGD